jgi:hypothetical protein
MTSRTDREIIARYPRLFDSNGDFTTAMDRGFENVGQSWLPILADMCERLMPLAEGGVRLLAVKSKYATLRIIARGGSEATDAVIAEAKEVAARTCSACGAAGERRTTAQGWVSVRCATCPG